MISPHVTASPAALIFHGAILLPGRWSLFMGFGSAYPDRACRYQLTHKFSRLHLTCCRCRGLTQDSTTHSTMGGQHGRIGLCLKLVISRGIAESLLEKGLVSRAESPGDRWVRIVALTKSGEDLIVPSLPQAFRGNRKSVCRCEPKELQILESVLRKLASAPGRLLKREASSSIHDRSVQNIGGSVIGYCRGARGLVTFRRPGRSGRRA